MKIKPILVGIILLIAVTTMFGQSKVRGGRGAESVPNETIENFAEQIAAAFVSRNLEPLDEGKPYLKLIDLTVEHSIIPATERTSVSNLKRANEWLTRNWTNVIFNTTPLERCSRGTCTFERKGMLHNNLFLRSITYGRSKGKIYIKELYFVDGD